MKIYILIVATKSLPTDCILLLFCSASLSFDLKCVIRQSHLTQQHDFVAFFLGVGLMSPQKFDLFFDADIFT